MTAQPPRPRSVSRSAAAIGAARGGEPVLVFAIALLVTGLLVMSIGGAIERRDRQAFEYEAQRTVDAISQRIDTAVTMLRGTVGLFAGSDEVGLHEFRAYIDELDLRTRYPGILGIGFSARIEPSQVAAVEQQMREAGIDDFRVWPDTPREEYHAIVYLEPLDARNRAAIGFDMYTNPVRRAAMHQARRSGEVAATGMVTLVQEIDERKQAGFLLYAPVYANGQDALPPDRRDLLGFAYSPLRVGDLLGDVLGAAATLIDFEVFDGTDADPGRLMRPTERPQHAARMSSDHVLDVAGRTWLLRFHSQPEKEALSQAWLVPWLGLGALATSLLLGWISWVQRREWHSAAAAAHAQQEWARALHREREWLSATLTGIGDGVIAVDEQGHVLLMNPVAERLTGWTAVAAIGRRVEQVVVTADAQPSPVEAALEGHSESGELMLRAQDGETIPVDHSSAPIRDQIGAIAGAVLVLRDATERHRIEIELRENDRRKDEFLATLAHELRNPLAPICNSLELLRRFPDGEKAEQVRAVAERQARHMVRLIDDLLDLSRISRGRIALQREPLLLAAPIEAAIDTSRPLIESRGHRLEVSPIDPALQVFGDPTRLAQVFANLLNNAATYTDPGGQIHLQVERDGDRVRVVVRDNGVGIAASSLPHVFDMFMQANRSPERSGGLGIGLTLVRQLVQLHGGSVEARSEGIGRGAEFIVRLPVYAGEVTSAGAVPAESPRVDPLRVLVVDDNRDAADSLAMMLDLDHHQVSVEYDGPSALQAALRQRPQAVLLDIGLPGMNGYEVARRLREQFGRTPLLVAVTGWGQQADRERAREAGFDEHLVKPVEYARLAALLRDHRLDPGRGGDLSR